MRNSDLIDVDMAACNRGSDGFNGTGVLQMTGLHERHAYRVDSRISNEKKKKKKKKKKNLFTRFTHIM